ncbi:hypothetical protein, partial [Roseomonas rosulenta]|uniref:hypothetical protein n=1 Tax=Roseomonas rosulenta TaxID=2748667 RepID=UPI0018E001DB
DAPGASGALTAAIRRADPAAGVWVDPSRGLVAVASAAPDAVIDAALAANGFPVRTKRRGGVGGALAFGVLFAVLGLFAGLVLGWVVGLGLYAVNPECHRPGSCTMMAPVFAVLGGVIGGPAGLIGGLVWGGVRRRRAAIGRSSS